MKSLPLVVSLGVVLLATGCAAPSSSISATHVPHQQHANQSCGDLIAQRSRIVMSLSNVSSQQDAAAAADKVGVFLVGLPISSIFGEDKEGQVALQKGRLIAIDAAIQLTCK